jgi:pimeloyl-ACP methyl ester carboxylesterase
LGEVDDFQFNKDMPMKQYKTYRFWFFIFLTLVPFFVAGPMRRWLVKEYNWTFLATNQELLLKKYTVFEHGTYEKILLETKDGCKRKGVLTLRPQAKGVVILCHPATFDKEFMKVFVDEVFTEYHCLRFDFRRHGEDAGLYYSTCGKKEVYEIEAAVDYVRNHLMTRGLPIYGFGISLGAGILVEAESKKPMFDGLILQATFDRLGLQIRRRVPFLNFPLIRPFIFFEPARFYLQKMHGVRLNRVNPIVSIKKISIPIFLIHAQDDAYIPFEAFQSLQKAAGGNVVKTWTPLSGGHTKLYSARPKEYARECVEFLDSLQKKEKVHGALFDKSNLFQESACEGYRMSLTATMSEMGE